MLPNESVAPKVPGLKSPHCHVRARLVKAPKGDGDLSSRAPGRPERREGTQQKRCQDELFEIMSALGRLDEESLTKNHSDALSLTFSL